MHPPIVKMALSGQIAILQTGFRITSADRGPGELQVDVREFRPQFQSGFQGLARFIILLLTRLQATLMEVARVMVRHELAHLFHFDGGLRQLAHPGEILSIIVMQPMIMRTTLERLLVNDAEIAWGDDDCRRVWVSLSCCSTRSRRAS